jgi:hypothetical protein
VYNHNYYTKQIGDTMSETHLTEKINDEEWDKPMVCPIDPKELAECEACQ